MRLTGGRGREGYRCVRDRGSKETCVSDTGLLVVTKRLRVMPIARLAEERQKRNKYLQQKVHETLALQAPGHPALLKVHGLTNVTNFFVIVSYRGTSMTSVLSVDLLTNGNSNFT